MKDEPFYFKHDCTAQDDPKLVRLQMDWGMEGIGIYWCLIERLQSPGNGGQIKADFPAIAWRWRVAAETLAKIVEQYFYVTQDGFIRCHGVDKRLAERKSQIEQARQAGFKSAAGRKKQRPLNPRSGSVNAPSTRRGEERKGEEKKEIQITEPSASDQKKFAGTVQEPNKTPLQVVVRAYKITKGVDPDDAAWDKASFKRYARAAQSLLEVCGNDPKAAVAFLCAKAEEFDAKGLDWTLDTIKKHAWDNKSKITEAMTNAGPQPFPMDDSKPGGTRRFSSTPREGAGAMDALRSIQAAGQEASRVAGQPGRPDDEQWAEPFLAEEHDGH